MIKTGVMQGRMLPRYKGQYQSFPVDFWEDDFDLARDHGVSCIELVVDEEGFKHNPLMSHAGVARLKELIQSTGVEVLSVNAHFHASNYIHNTDKQAAQHSYELLMQVIKRCGLMGVGHVVLPCMEVSDLKGSESKARFFKKIPELLLQAASFNLNLLLETDLPPEEVREILEQVDSQIFGVCYDTGNSASKGYDLEEEFVAYGRFIKSIHIKDKELHGGQISLGQGAVDFDLFLSLVKKMNYSGLMIMETCRDHEDGDFAAFKQQFDFLQDKLKTHGLLDEGRDA